MLNFASARSFAGKIGMCGIAGYIGKRKAIPIVLDGIKRLEYRGYDSAGLVAIRKNGNPYFKKVKGRVDVLIETVNPNISVVNAIAHSRWATHGQPSVKNAHPHFDCKKNIFLVHNGIIENYKEIKKELIWKRHIFSSDTDTEVLAHLIEEILKNPAVTFEEAVRRALGAIRGTYALAIVNTQEPYKIIVARNFSPLLIGVGDQEFFIASDASAVLPYTRKVVYLNDGEFAVITPKEYRIATLHRNPVERKAETIEWSLEDAQKKGHSHFMLKEILEEPEAVENAIRGRLIVSEGEAKLGGLESVGNELRKMNRLLISACGTAHIAGLVGECMIEEYAGIPVETEYASEFRYKKQVFDPNTVLLTVSQSGETADTLAAIREAKRKGLLVLGVTNVIGSSIARETRAGVYNHAGPEIGVASTKAFLSQLAVFALLTLFLGRQKGMSLVMGKRIAQELQMIPEKMRKILKQQQAIKAIAKKYSKYNNFLYLGRKYNLPIAEEGALKLKEISYIHAEGYGAGEMKHGPIALIDKNFPSLVIAPSDSVYEKIESNIQEIKARNGKVIAIATEGNKQIAKLVDDVIYIPKTLEMLTPLLSVVPLHLFAYYVGVLRGHDVDKPRNLAKSVTVE